jgi:hypothetical protein
VGLLASVYDTVAAAAEKLRDIDGTSTLNVETQQDAQIQR